MGCGGAMGGGASKVGGEADVVHVQKAALLAAEDGGEGADDDAKVAEYTLSKRNASEVPSEIQFFTNLRTLDLSWNLIETIPGSTCVRSSPAAAAHRCRALPPAAPPFCRVSRAPSLPVLPQQQPCGAERATARGAASC